jgi:UDP-glucose 4-epimerase
MRVLITGGCGFIGSHIARYHLGKGDKVHVVDDLSTGTLENITAFRSNPLFHFDKADIIIWPGLVKSVALADRIYHMAAVMGVHHLSRASIKVISTNIAGTERLLRAVKATGAGQRVIIASSSEVYGLTDKPQLNEEDSLVFESAAQMTWSFAISKLADEALGMVYNHVVNTPITVVRIFNAIGPGQTSSHSIVVPRFVKQACRGQPITVFGDGKQSRCFCDVRDLAASLDVLAAASNSVGEIVNVGNDREIQMNDLAMLVRERANSKSEIIYVPFEEAYMERSVSAMRRKPDLKKFYNLTNYKHQWTLEDTIDDIISEYQYFQHV